MALSDPKLTNRILSIAFWEELLLLYLSQPFNFLSFDLLPRVDVYRFVCQCGDSRLVALFLQL